MPYRLSEKERIAVLSETAEKRGVYCLTKMFKQTELWGAKSYSWFLERSTEGFDYFPVWPHPGLAVCALTERYPKYVPEAIPREEWLENWLPLFEFRKIQVAMIPNEHWDFIGVDPVELKQSLIGKLSQYS